MADGSFKTQDDAHHAKQNKAGETKEPIGKMETGISAPAKEIKPQPINDLLSGGMPRSNAAPGTVLDKPVVTPRSKK